MPRLRGFAVEVFLSSLHFVVLFREKSQSKVSRRQDGTRGSFKCVVFLVDKDVLLWEKTWKIGIVWGFLSYFSFQALTLSLPSRNAREILGEREGGKRIFDLIKSDKTLKVDWKRSLVCRTLDWIGVNWLDKLTRKCSALFGFFGGGFACFGSSCLLVCMDRWARRGKTSQSSPKKPFKEKSSVCGIICDAMRAAASSRNYGEGNSFKQNKRKRFHCLIYPPLHWTLLAVPLRSATQHTSEPPTDLVWRNYSKSANKNPKREKFGGFFP
jgi:hypothetical protein